VKRILIGLLALITSCAGETDEALVGVPGVPTALKGSLQTRAARRAYEGAPPVIPHVPFGIRCVECHTQRGMAVEGVGFAPPSPHAGTAGMSEGSRCNQCHVFSVTQDIFVESAFEGWQPASIHGPRAHDNAPPVMPHPVHLRENCLACHSGPAAREEVRTTHPERANCQQCHVPRSTDQAFQRG